MAPARPLISDVSRPFWDGLRHERICIQQCKACESFIFYPRLLCPFCGGEPGWREVSGRASLYTFTLAQAPVSPDFEDAGPLLLAIAELEEGVRIPTTLVDAGPEQVSIGMALEPVFDHATFGDITLLRYRAASATPTPDNS